MSAWNHEAADLFRAGRASTPSTSADRERVRARLAAKLGAAAVGAAVTTTSATAAGGVAGGAATAKGGALALVAKIAAPIVVVAGAAGVAVPHVMRARASLAPATTVATTATAAPRPPRAAPPAAPARQEATEAPTMRIDDLPAAAPKTAPRARPSATTAATSEAALEEARLVASMDDALRSGDAPGALRLADEHARRFPHGVLVEEREGGRVIARCMTGARASSGADAFLAAHPRSPMRGRIVAACGTGEEK